MCARKRANDRSYDAWGNILSITGTHANTIGQYNPLRYRGYVYDSETDLYYLQSRYYDPAIGRFLNADAFASTGQGLLGNNMFAYCLNNPTRYVDSSGQLPLEAAFGMFERWFFEEEESHVYGEGSRIVRLLKKSKRMKESIDDAIENRKRGKLTTSGTGEFTAAEDGWELYLSTQHYRYIIDVKEEKRTVGLFMWRHEEIRYIATIVVYDVYNFDNLREWDGIGNILNNGAYIAHQFGFGNDYKWYATYTYTTEWEAI